MKTILISFFAIVCCVSVNAQRGAFFELGGPGGFGSINYEKTFATTDSWDFRWRVGASGFPIDKNNGTALFFPVMAEGILGTSPHKLELGWGQTLTVTTKGSFFLQMPTHIGYRFQGPDRKFYYRVGYTPLISYLVDFQYQHWGGLSIGIQLP